MKQVLSTLVVLLGMIFLAGCGGTDKGSGKEGSQMKGKSGGARGMQMQQGLPVEVTRLERGVIGRKLMYSGTIETEYMTDVIARVSGQIREIRVDEGQRVTKDSIVMVVDDREYKISEQKARVNYLQLKSALDRLIKLKKDDLVSEEEFEKTKFGVDQARLEWDMARLNLQYTRVRAPFSGVITERFIKLGDYIQTSSRLFSIANMTKKIIKVYVPQNETPLISLNLPVEVTTDILPGVILRGWVKRISPAVDVESGTFKVTIGVNDPENRVLPGMFVNTGIIVAKHENALLLPKAALVYENDRAFFFAVQGDSVRKIQAVIGFDDAEKVELNQDLPEGLPVVVVGQTGLKDGSAVRIVSRKIFTWQKKQESMPVLTIDKPVKPRMGKKGRRPDSLRKKHRRPTGAAQSAVKPESGE